MQMHFEEDPMRGSVSWKERGKLLLPGLVLVGAFALFYALYFSPALLHGYLLAPGDGEIYYYPFFNLPAWEIWNGSILSGYPVVADIQAQTFYPLRWLSPTFNVLVVSAYVVMATGMFGLALKATGSRLGALTGALVVSGSGFMVAHLGHLAVIHAAAWVPWILWALASIRGARTAWPIVLGAVAVALSLLGGHPQVSIIGLMLAGGFGIHEILAAGSTERLRVTLHTAAMFALGLCLAAPSLLPFYEAASQGVRSDWSLEAFNAFSHDAASLRLLAFPNLYGANGAGPFDVYNGPWNLTELAIYVGILPILLSLVAVSRAANARGRWFWAIAGAIALLLSMGAATPLGVLVHKLPVLGQFRAQARFGIAVAICVGMLSAFGLSALLQAAPGRLRAAALTAAGAALSVLAVASVLTRLPSSTLPASANVWVPCVLMVLSLAAFALLLWRRSLSIVALSLLLIVVDLGTFGWFYEWRYGRPPQDQETTAQAAEVLADLARGPGRLLPLNAAQMPAIPLRPNVNMGHGIASVAGYGPLVSARYSGFAGADPTGGFAVTDPSAPLMDVLAVRWIAGDTASAQSYALGSGCGSVNSLREIKARVPSGTRIAAVRVISHLSCSTTTVDGAAIVDVRLLDAHGKTVDARTLDAGEETAEWAYDRPDVRSTVAHSRPEVAETFSAGDFNGLWFKAQWPVTDGASADVDVIDISLRDGAPAPIRIKAVELVDAGGKTIPVSLAPVLAEDSLAPARTAAGLPPLRERLGYRSMAWAVCEGRTTSAADIQAQLGGLVGEHGRLDAYRTALIEPGVPLPALACSAPPKVSVRERSAGRWVLDVDGAGPALLVVSESYNSGWRARVDAVKASILPVDGLVMGVAVPAGAHEVVLSYWPRSFRIGLGLAFLAMLACVAFLLPWRRVLRAVDRKNH
ncbi:MAG TPA: YfhO family protein [Lysobacter sp.]